MTSQILSCHVFVLNTFITTYCSNLYFSSNLWTLLYNQLKDGYLEGELLDGRKGLVPSNLIERLSGEDLLEFHQSCVLGVQEEDIW